MTDLALNHTLWLPYSGQRIGVDNILIPDGTILPNQPGSLNDFWTTPKQLGANFSSPDLLGNCGFNCTGYGKLLSSKHISPLHSRKRSLDLYQHGFTRHRLSCHSRAIRPLRLARDPPVARLQSAWSGIQVDVYNDQEAFQVYSCNGQNGT